MTEEMASSLMQDCGWTALFFALEGKVNHNLEVFDYLLRTKKVDISVKDEVRIS